MKRGIFRNYFSCNSRWLERKKTLFVKAIVATHVSIDPDVVLSRILEHPFQPASESPEDCSNWSCAFWKRAMETACTSTSMAVLDWNLRKAVFDCSSAFRERLELEQGGTIAHRLSEEDRAVFLENIRQILQNGTAKIHRVRWNSGENCSRVLAVRDAALELDGEGNPARLFVLVQDLTVADEALHAMQSIRNSANERVSESHTLLREMNHRVKNNLQIVCALIHSHSDGLEDPAARSSFSDIESRVRTIAHLHDRLSHGFGTLEAAGILRDLAALVAQTSALSRQRFVLDLENIDRPLGIAQAMPFAMAANELLMNSIQHGTADTPVTVQLRALPDGSLRLTVRNGIRSAPAGTSSGLGTEILQALCRQLGATFHSEFAWNEASCHLVLPPAKEALRV